MAALRSRCGLIFLPCGFFFYLLFFFPRLISAVANWMSDILAHMVWPFSANLGRRSKTCCMRLVENTGRKKWRKCNSPSAHHRTTLSGYIFAIKAHIDNRKKNLLNSNTSPTFPYNMVNFGPLAAEIGSEVWGTLANFNGFRVLAALLHGTLVVGVSQTLRRWTEGATYIRQGGHHVGHWPTS